MPGPTLLEQFILAANPTTTDRSLEIFSKAFGRNGRIVSAVAFAGNATWGKRGQVLIEGIFVTRGTAEAGKIRARIAGGYLYEGTFLPGGHGSIPFSATDFLIVMVRNTLASAGVDVILTIADDKGEPTSWVEHVDTRTDGADRRIALADPAAGAEWANQTVPTNARWLVRGIISTDGLVTDATAGNRVLTIRYDDGTAIIAGGKSDPIPPSSTSPLFGGIGVPTSPTPLAAGMAGGISLPEAYIPEGGAVSFITDNLAAADNWGAGSMGVEEFIEP